MLVEQGGTGSVTPGPGFLGPRLKMANKPMVCLMVKGLILPGVSFLRKMQHNSRNYQPVPVTLDKD
jgi:hypothetical protein